MQTPASLQLIVHGSLAANNTSFSWLSPNHSFNVGILKSNVTFIKIQIVAAVGYS